MRSGERATARAVVGSGSSRLGVVSAVDILRCSGVLPAGVRVDRETHFSRHGGEWVWGSTDVQRSRLPTPWPRIATRTPSQRFEWVPNVNIGSPIFAERWRACQGVCQCTCQ